MADSNDQTTVIGADTHIKGEMSFDKSARIVGRFDGKIESKGELHVCDAAKCSAEINAITVVVDGDVEGNISAKERITLNAKAVVKGDVVAAKLVVAEGAAFEGHCRVGASAGKPRPESSPAEQQKAKLAQPLTK